MLSLDNAYDEAELTAFDERVRKGLALDPDTAVVYVAELKIDGLSIALHYRDGVLVGGVTRGDGVRGEDVTSNVRAIRGIPLSLKTAVLGHTEVRGEIFLPRASFDRMNAERVAAGESPFANPRNAAAGTMRTLDPALVARRGLGAFIYHLVARSGAGSGDDPAQPGGQAAVLERLAAWGLPVDRHWRRCDGMTQVVAFCREWAEGASRAAVRHRWRRHQGRPSGRPGSSGADGEVPPVGDGVQVPCRAGDHAAAPDRGQRGQDRRSDPLRRARTGAAGRDNGATRYLAQRGRCRPQRRPGGRHRAG